MYAQKSQFDFKAPCNQNWLAPGAKLPQVDDLMSNFAQFRTEGYWRQALRHPLMDLPFPQADMWPAEDAVPFAMMLKRVEEKLDSLGLVVQFKGFSLCRLCPKEKVNGTREYFLETWKWPQGLHHYVLEHRVKPSDDFIAFIENAYHRLEQI